jgi:uncharacterized protein YkwD
VSRHVVLLVVALLITRTGQLSAAAGTSGASDPATRVMSLINEARAARGLVALRSDSRLSSLAVDRATSLAATGILSHDAAGSLPEGLAARGIQWYGYGEDIGYASGKPGAAAGSIFRMLAASPTHWDLMMSGDYNYLGVGFVYRPSSGLTYGSVVLTESRDRTGPRSTILGAVFSGDDIRWSWRGWDPPLQTRTAGLRDFSVQLRMDRGPWSTIASGTATTARSTLNRLRGHWYGLRVQARDRAGNVGSWSPELRIWLP